MPLFYYSGKDAKGRNVRGIVDAISAKDARDSLRDMNIESEELHEATIEEKKAADTNSFDSLNESSIIFDVLEEKDGKENINISTDNKKIVNTSINKSVKIARKEYHPFIDTMRLYAGWLLAWYILVYAFGSYQITRELPFNIPYVEALLPPYSGIVFSCTFAAFLFLMLSKLHKIFSGGILRGALFILFGIAIFFLYRINI